MSKGNYPFFGELLGGLSLFSQRNAMRELLQ